MELDLSPRATNVALARWAVDGLGSSLPAAVCEDVRLLVSELVTNCIRHAHLADLDSITLGIRVGGNVVHVDVVDHGSGFHPSERSLQPAEPAESGLGLYLLDRLADRWGIEWNGGTRVWFEKDVSPGDRSQAGPDPGGTSP